MKQRVIYAQSLFELVEQKKEVNPWDLTETAESFYKSIKVVGLKNTTLKYINSKGIEETKKGSEVSEEARAIVGLIVKLLYRWTDDNSGRIEKHLGLSMLIHFILGETKIYVNDHAALECISVEDVINKYLSK